jgi:hypothetical protein
VPESGHRKETTVDLPEPRRGGPHRPGRRRGGDLTRGSGGDRGGGWRLRGVPGI